MKKKTIYWIVGIGIIIYFLRGWCLTSGLGGGTPNGCKTTGHEQTGDRRAKWCSIFMGNECEKWDQSLEIG